MRGNWRAGIRWMEIELSSGCIQLKGSLVICMGGVFGSVEGAKPFPSPSPAISYFGNPFSPGTLADSFEVEFVVVWSAFAFAFLLYVREPVLCLRSTNFPGTTPFAYHTGVSLIKYLVTRLHFTPFAD